MNFQQLGKIIDDLQLDRKLNQVSKIMEDLANPKVQVKDEEAWDSHCWMKCKPRIPETKAVQLYFANVNKVSKSLEKLGYRISSIEAGILATLRDTVFRIQFNDWIVVSDKDVLSVWTDDAFKENFELLDHNW